MVYWFTISDRAVLGAIIFLGILLVLWVIWKVVSNVAKAVELASMDDAGRAKEKKKRERRKADDLDRFLRSHGMLGIQDEIELIERQEQRRVLEQERRDPRED